MHRFFGDEENRISGEEALHLSRVLRLKAGDEIEVLREGRRFLARLCLVEKGSAAYEIMMELENHEPKCRVTLYQGLCKGERMEYIAQKCTEMGVHGIVPVVMERTQGRQSGDHRLERLRRIAAEAAKQCGRAHVPFIATPLPFQEALKEMGGHERLLMPYEEGGAPVGGNMPLDLGLVIGPEGGIDPKEARAVLDAGGEALTLGPRILRTETAGLVALTVALYLSGDMGAEGRI